jgi:spoIIIJ-associated protein
MNPFERRLIHTALNEFEGVTTKSEGEGLLKQVRILVDPNLPPLREQKEV